MLNDCLEKWNKYINAYRNKLPSNKIYFFKDAINLLLKMKYV